MNQKELINKADQLIEKVKHIFPDTAEFSARYDTSRKSYICKVNWKLGNDLDRPNKRSKIINIVISCEALDDYFSTNDIKQQNATNRFVTLIEKEYKNFDPNHNGPQPPVEEWVITSNILNN